jgi:hypothetical protein
MRQCSTRTRHLRRLRSCETAPPIYDTHDQILQEARRVCIITEHPDRPFSLVGGKIILSTLTEKVPTMRGLH